MVSYHPARFGGNRHCGSGDINTPANIVILAQMQDVIVVTVHYFCHYCFL